MPEDVVFVEMETPIADPFSVAEEVADPSKQEDELNEIVYLALHQSTTP